VPFLRHVFVGIEPLLRRTQGLGDVLQIDADPRPGTVASAQRIDKHVGGLKLLRGARMTSLPAIESGQCVRLFSRAADLDQRLLGDTAA
jgi:hypothetical protein